MRGASFFSDLGMLAAAITSLADRKPRWPQKSFGEYIASLGPITQDEPAVVVKVRLDDQHEFRKEGEHEFALASDDGVSTNICVLEMPQDYFYYLRGHHQGSFEISQALPPYFFGMGVMQAHTLFEVYLEDLLADVYRTNPSLIPDAKASHTYLQHVQHTNGDAEDVLEAVVRKVMRLPMLAVLTELRDVLGFSGVEASAVSGLQRSALVRNSIAHGAVVTEKLAAAFPNEFRAGDSLPATRELFEEVVTALRKCVFELELARPADVAARQEPAFAPKAY
jgi:hypothetical protein